MIGRSQVEVAQSTLVVNSDDTMHQIHESTETRLFADDVVQVQQRELVLLDWFKIKM